MTALRFKRRTVLRGFLRGAAVTVGLPALEAMFNSNGTAHADGGALPRRMGIFFFGNGVRLKFWTPAEIGAGWKLTPSLEPLQEVRDYINVVSGMNVMTGNGQGHHSGTVGILSGAPYSPPKFNGRSTFSAPSIDQVAANEIGKTSRFKSLEVGVCHGVKFVEGTTLGYLSHNGPDSPNPPEYEPHAFFTRLFGGGAAAPTASPAATPDKAALLRKSVLDAVLSDINGLRGQVSAFDRTRLDQHTDNIRRLETRLTSRPAASCASAKDPGVVSGPVSHEPMEEVTNAMSQLLAMALSCDQTRVFSMMFSGSVGQHIFWP
ncbi:MAG TPA: DUF1552 domain-containing protein, partial [Polyangia bacterium]|nr:DUF1552 domain-containing protein [Polyangia bacterium]